VLSLAADRPGVIALLDDKLARRMAHHLGILFTGTLGVLLRAKTAGHLASVRPTIERLEALGFRLDAATRSAILELSGES
jgi:predicted nucleic acid-binding protein